MNILNKMTRVELISAPREAYPDKFGGLFWLIFLAAVKTALMTGRKMKPAALLGDSQLSFGTEAIWMRWRHS